MPSSTSPYQPQWSWNWDWVFRKTPKNRDHEQLLEAVEDLRDDIANIATTLNTLLEKGNLIMAQLDAITAEVTRNTQVIAGAVIAFERLAAKIEELKNDPVALQALADELSTGSTKLAEAVVAHTPSE